MAGFSVGQRLAIAIIMMYAMNETDAKENMFWEAI